MTSLREQIYNLMDGFLVEGDSPRPIERLNQDRHLFVDRVIALLSNMSWMPEKLDRKDKFYAKGEIEAGFERVYNEALKEVRENFKKFLG